MISPHRTQPPTFRLRRIGQSGILDGLSEKDLRILADWAHLHPMDEISVDGKHWIHAHQFRELGMVWYLLVDGQEVYGPTTVGTLKEFYVNGEVGPPQLLRHALTREEKTLEALIGRDYIQKATQSAIEAPPPAGPSSAPPPDREHAPKSNSSFSG